MSLIMADHESTEEASRLTTQLRIERDLWERAKAQARRLRMSTNSYAVNAIEWAVKADEKETDSD